MDHLNVLYDETDDDEQIDFNLPSKTRNNNRSLVVVSAIKIFVGHNEL